MKLFLEILIVITSIVLTFSILFQSGNSAGLSGSIGGGAEQLFGKKKSKGYETILSRITTVCAVIFFICAVAATAIPDGATAALQAQNVAAEAAAETENAASEAAAEANNAASEAAAEASNAASEAKAEAENAASENKAEAENAAAENKAEAASAAANN